MLEVDGPIVATPGPVVVDHGVAGRPVQPGRRVLHPLERPRSDTAHHHVLGDVSGQLGVADAAGHEGSHLIDGLAPVVFPALADRADSRIAHGRYSSPCSSSDELAGGWTQLTVYGRHSGASGSDVL